MAAVIRPTVHARAAEDGLDDFAVVEVGDDDAVLDGVAADDAAGRDLQIEDGIAGGRELVDELLGRGAAIEDALVGFFEDHDATALDARIVGVDGGGDEVGEGDVGDEAAALVHLQQGSSPSFHSATRTLPLSMPVSTPT